MLAGLWLTQYSLEFLYRLWPYGTVAVTGPHLKSSELLVFLFCHLALAVCQENGLFEEPFCLYEPEILPVPAEVGNMAKPSRR
jgi:hypothetical protein